MTNRRDLTNQVCLVTGGASGIGWAVCQLLAARGACVQMCDVSAENLSRVRQMLSGGPYESSITTCRVDVTDQVAVNDWVATAYAQHGVVDVLVNNAAYISWASVEQMAVSDAELSMRTGFDAMVYTIAAVLPLMRAAGGGHIVNMGSSAGKLLVEGPSAAYAAAKAAIEAYTEILRLELNNTPISVMLVRPGVVAGTQFFGRHVRSDQLPRLVDFLPAATPDRVAKAIVQGIIRDRRTVDIPWFLPLMYRAYALSPWLFQHLTDLGGPARRDYAVIRPVRSRKTRS